MPIPVRRLNHAVLYVRDVDRAVDFYQRAFGFLLVERAQGFGAAFLRSSFDQNHHDLGLFEVGPSAPRPERGRVGLYHLAWEVDSITDLAAAREVLAELGALVGASDHGVSKSLYGVDPDGNEFEIVWTVPEEEWRADPSARVEPLDLEAELARWGAPPA